MKMQEFIHEPPFECEISPELIKGLFDELDRLVPKIDANTLPDGLESITYTYHADDNQHVSVEERFEWPEWNPQDRSFARYVLTIHENHAPFDDFLEEMASKGYSTEELAEVLDYYPLMSREIGVMVSPDLDVSFWKSGVELDIGNGEVPDDEMNGFQGMRGLNDSSKEADYFNEDEENYPESLESEELKLTFDTRDLAYIYWVLEKLEPNHSASIDN